MIGTFQLSPAMARFHLWRIFEWSEVSWCCKDIDGRGKGRVKRPKGGRETGKENKQADCQSKEVEMLSSVPLEATSLACKYCRVPSENSCDCFGP